MNVIDLFCGCGGFSKGFSLAGFDIRLGVDIWADAVKTYNHNFKTASTITEDITNLSGIDLLKEAGLSADDVDVIIGGPPVKAFLYLAKDYLMTPETFCINHSYEWWKKLNLRFLLWRMFPG